ncbi:MAG: dockerin type I repeat-containing protein [Clostridia bacterium]|nr:dockerin type I repeat-containing protein [Clostridia bacterium]
MKNKLLKFSLILFFILVFVLLTSSICNALTIENTKYTLDKENHMISRILPGTSANDFLNAFSITDGGTTKKIVRDKHFTIEKTNEIVYTGDYAEFKQTITSGDAMMSAAEPYVLSVIGDINGDGISDQRDLSLLIRHYIGLENCILTEPEELKSADINNDTEINTIDLTKLIRYIVTEDIEYLKTENENNRPEGTYEFTFTIIGYDGGYKTPGNDYTPTETSSDIGNTKVIINNTEYDLTDAERTEIKQSDSLTLTGLKKVKTFYIEPGTKISLRTDNLSSETSWMYYGSKLEDGYGISFEMPSEDIEMTVSNGFDTGRYEVNNNLRAITGYKPKHQKEYKFVAQMGYVDVIEYYFLISNKISGANNISPVEIEELYQRINNSGNSNESATKNDAFDPNWLVITAEGKEYDLTGAQANGCKVECNSSQSGGKYHYEFRVYYYYEKSINTIVRTGEKISVNTSNDVFWLRSGGAIYGVKDANNITDYSRRRKIDFYMPAEYANISVSNTNGPKYSREAINLNGINKIYDGDVELNSLSYDTDNIYWETFE